MRGRRRARRQGHGCLDGGSVSQTDSPSRLQKLVGWVLLALGLAVFAVRSLHEGPYPIPQGTNLFAGLGALLLGAALVWSATPRALRWLAMAGAPIVLFFGLYATMSELEEVVSLFATDRSGRPADLRLWIVDREDGAWVGMPRVKALEHSLNGAKLQVLRKGQTLCVVPVLYEDRATVKAVHALKVEKYAVARGAAALALYPREARDTAVALRLDPCPAGS